MAEDCRLRRGKGRLAKKRCCSCLPVRAGSGHPKDDDDVGIEMTKWNDRRSELAPTR